MVLIFCVCFLKQVYCLLRFIVANNVATWFIDRGINWDITCVVTAIIRCWMYSCNCCIWLTWALPSFPTTGSDVVRGWQKSCDVGAFVFFCSTESTLSTGWVNIDLMLWLHCGGLMYLTTFKHVGEFGKEGTTYFSNIWQLLSVWIMFALYSNFTVLYKKLEARSLPLSPSLSRFLKVLGHSLYIGLSLNVFFKGTVLQNDFIPKSGYNGDT